MSWEVLSRLSPELKQFLERISVLDRLTWGSCQAVSGMEKGKELMEEAFSVGLLNWDSGEKEPSGHMLLGIPDRSAGTDGRRGTPTAVRVGRQVLSGFGMPGSWQQITVSGPAAERFFRKQRRRRERLFWKRKTMSG